MKKITFFLHCLIAGGVQKSVVTLANYLSQKYKITVILADDTQDIFYKLKDEIDLLYIKTKKVDIKKLGVGEEIFNYRVNELNQLLNIIKPDLAISYEDYHNLILLSTTYRCKKIISCRNVIDEKYSIDSFIHIYTRELYLSKIKELYSKADLIITVSDYIRDELKHMINTDNITTIHNGISQSSNKISKLHVENKFILNISRLAIQKGQIDLIKSFNIIKDEIEHDLLIVGDGALKTELLKLIIELRLENRVFLLGTQEPYSYIQECDLFVFPSYFEGFSNIILEVMSMHKPIIAYKYLGSEEILDVKNLVPRYNMKALAKKMLLLLKDKQLAKEVSKSQYIYSQKFSLERSLNAYSKAINTVMNSA